MSDETPRPGSPEVIKHLDLLQSVITRMAANSSACKGWAIALVSAVLAFLASKKSSGISGLIAAIPLILFFVMDTYYLILERRFRDVYDDFVSRLHEGKALQRELFVLKPPPKDKKIAFKIRIRNKIKIFWDTVKSHSVWPFYTLLTLMISGVSFLVLGASSCGDFGQPLCQRSEGQPVRAAEVSGRDAPNPGLGRRSGVAVNAAPLKPPTPSPAIP